MSESRNYIISTYGISDIYQNFDATRVCFCLGATLNASFEKYVLLCIFSNVVSASLGGVGGGCLNT